MPALSIHPIPGGAILRVSREHADDTLFEMEADQVAVLEAGCAAVRRATVCETVGELVERCG